MLSKLYVFLSESTASVIGEELAFDGFDMFEIIIAITVLLFTPSVYV